MADNPSQILRMPPMLAINLSLFITGLSSTIVGYICFSNTFNCRKFSPITVHSDVFYNSRKRPLLRQRRLHVAYTIYTPIHGGLTELVSNGDSRCFRLQSSFLSSCRPIRVSLTACKPAAALWTIYFKYLFTVLMGCSQAVYLIHSKNRSNEIGTELAYIMVQKVNHHHFLS